MPHRGPGTLVPIVSADYNFMDASPQTSVGKSQEGITPFTVQGTWFNKAGEVENSSDVNLDHYTYPVDVNDYAIEMQQTGQYGTGTVNRVPAILGRYIDASNTLFIFCVNGTIKLNKLVAGVNTNLASFTVALGADQTMWPIAMYVDGAKITIFWNGIKQGGYTLTTSGESAFLGQAATKKIGVALVKTGTGQTTPIKVYNFYAYPPQSWSPTLGSKAPV